VVDAEEGEYQETATAGEIRQLAAATKHQSKAFAATSSHK